MIINNKKFLSYFLLFSILFLNCKVDYDIEEVAPIEHLTTDQAHDHTAGEECAECDSEHDHEHTDEEVCPECYSEHDHEHTDEEVCPECYSEHDQAHDHAAGEECVECDSEHPATNEEHVTEQIDDSHAGHNHDTGARNHGTEWFFNQPWAAPFIWPKLFRDALIFLGLAVVLFIITARKGKK